VADDTGDQLIKVAREILAKRGYLGLTMKTASAAAGVTPDVAMRYYRNRDALIAAALRLPSDPIAAIPTLVAPGVEGMGERLVRYMLDILRDPQTRDELVSLARTGVNAGHAMAGLQDFLERAIVDRVATTIGVPDARMRSALITSYLLGVAMTRYGVRLEPLASASEEDVVRMVAPVIQDLIDPRKPLPGSARARAASSGAASVSDPSARTRRTFDPDPKATAARAARRGAPAGSASTPKPPSAAEAPAASRPKAAPAPAPTTSSARATAAARPAKATPAKASPTRAAAKAHPNKPAPSSTASSGSAPTAAREATADRQPASTRASRPATSSVPRKAPPEGPTTRQPKHAAGSTDDAGTRERPQRGT
jgi:AcrR family transcriptional regulator